MCLGFLVDFVIVLYQDECKSRNEKNENRLSPIFTQALIRSCMPWFLLLINQHQIIQIPQSAEPTGNSLNIPVIHYLISSLKPNDWVYVSLIPVGEGGGRGETGEGGVEGRGGGRGGGQPQQLGLPDWIGCFPANHRFKGFHFSVGQKWTFSQSNI